METPYIDNLKATLETQKCLLSLLENRIVYLTTEIGNAEVEHYHLNEAKINVIKTQAEIETLKKVIAEKTTYFEKYAVNFEIEYAEMEKKYDKLIENAYLRAAKNTNLKSILDRVNKDVLKTDKEAKLLFYKTLKEHLV
jgi:hypothetical protein